MKKLILMCFYHFIVLYAYTQSEISIQSVNILPSMQFPDLKENIEYLVDSSIVVKQFTEDGKIIMTGKLKSLDPRIKHGKFTYYDLSSKPILLGRYSENMPVGIWQSFDLNGNVVKQINYSKVLEYMASQTKIEESDLVTDIMPTFNTGSYTNFSNYLRDNLVFPINAIKEKVNETVFVSFVINKQGDIVNPEIVKGQNLDLNLEIIRVLSEAPKWTPGHNKNGDLVNIKFTYPIAFINSTISPQDSIKTIIDLCYPEGELGFRKDLVYYIQIPKEDIQNGIYGLSIAKIELPNNGDAINVKIVNSLSKGIDNEVKLVIHELLKRQWNPIFNGSDTLIFYMPIKIRYNENVLSEPLKLNTNKMIDEVIITPYRNLNNKSPNTIKNKIQKALENENCEDVLLSINELLKIEPFNIEIRALKIDCLTKLGKIEEVENEVMLLNNYMDNKSIKELLLKNTP